jgi:hypothetical protein
MVSVTVPSRPLGFDAAVQIGIRQPNAERQQPRVGGRLRRAQLGRVVDVLPVIDGPAQPALRQRVDVVEIDLVDVVERGAKRREEARPAAVNACSERPVRAP